MAKSPEFHYDLLGREIRKGSFVAANSWNGLTVCVVDSLSPKMIKIRKVIASGNNWPKNIYPKDSIIIENEEDITMYILKNGAKS
jgi:hypothetical protein